jgi:hypothetical protein
MKIFRRDTFDQRGTTEWLGISERNGSLRTFELERRSRSVQKRREYRRRQLAVILLNGMHPIVRLRTEG